MKGFLKMFWTKKEKAQVIQTPSGDQFTPCVGIERGDVWRVKIMRENKVDEGDFVVVSTEEENRTKPYVIMVNTTDLLLGKPRRSRFKFKLGNETKYAICETVKKVDGKRLLHLKGKLNQDDIATLDKALAYTVGIGCGGSYLFKNNGYPVDDAEFESDYTRIKQEHPEYQIRYDEDISDTDF